MEKAQTTGKNKADEDEALWFQTIKFWLVFEKSFHVLEKRAHLEIIDVDESRGRNRRDTIVVAAEKHSLYRLSEIRYEISSDTWFQMPFELYGDGHLQTYPNRLESTISSFFHA